jgi:tRNA1Val (adenine37-N6)-methyltransferase
MSNCYFQFKQFKIEQGDCAMKVTTEGCILGGWVNSINPKRILDIGTGTGVLSLMLAQRHNCPIDAVEIDETTAKQALNNFQNSQWNETLNLYHQGIENFTSSCKHKYDLIISNPPFFKSNLKSESKTKNLAIHDSSLPQEMILKAISILITDHGKAFVIYPEYEAHQFLKLIQQFGMHCRTSLIIRNKPEGDIFRKVVELSKSELSRSEFPEEFNIRNEQNEFSHVYVEMLRPYYLHL